MNPVIHLFLRLIIGPEHGLVHISAGVLNGWLDSDFIQLVRHNTINSWYYINSLWNKWIFDTIYCAHLRVNLNKSGASSMEQKFHRRYYINILVSGYLSFNWKERIAIDKAGSRSMIQKLFWRVLSILQIDKTRRKSFCIFDHETALSMPSRSCQLNNKYADTRIFM